MAITFAGNAGSATSITNNHIIAFTTTRTINVGETLILPIVYDNRFTSVLSIADGGGSNTYAQDGGASAIADDSMEFWRTTVVAQIASGSTITVTFSGASGTFVRAVIGDVFDGMSSGATDKSSYGLGPSNFSTSVTPGTTGTLSQTGELAYSAAFAENVVNISTTAGYTQTAQVQSGTALTFAAQYQILAATTAQNPSVNWLGSTPPAGQGASQACGASIATYLPAAGGGDTLFAQSVM